MYSANNRGVRWWHTAIKAEEDLVGPGAEPGTIPTDLEQATGMERLEILGKIEGIDVFDMKPLDASRKGVFRPTTLRHLFTAIDA